MKMEGLKVIVKGLERSLKKFNIEKSKMTIFKKEGGKGNNANWKCKGERVEEVTEFLYLGIRFQRNGHLINHIKERIKSTDMIMN